MADKRWTKDKQNVNKRSTKTEGGQKADKLWQRWTKGSQNTRKKYTKGYQHLQKMLTKGSKT